MFLTFRYRLLPTKRQHHALEGILEDQRQLYNAGLEERIDAFRKKGIARTYVDQCYALTEWRRDDVQAAAFPANLQRWTLKRLDEAYAGFFRRLQRGGKPGYPRFRGKGRFGSFGFREFSGICFRRGKLRFKGLPGSLRVHLHRPLPDGAVIRSCVFRRELRNWYVGFVVEIAEAPLRKGNRAVGMDLGITTLGTLSDGTVIPSLKAARRSERRLRIAQRALSRKIKGSRNRRKARTDVARCYSRIARWRANHLHQASARLVRDYDTIVVEKLNIMGLARSSLAKEVYDASWAKFISMLRYKAECAGCRLIEVDPYGTTQDCSDCGMSVPKSLSDRCHDCPHCGLVLNRDLNAARNILNRAAVGPGLHNVAEYGMRAGGNLSGSAGNQRSLR